MGGADFVQWHGNYPMLAAHGRNARAGRRAAEAPWRTLKPLAGAIGSWLVEAFALVNFAGLVGDIYLAHSTNQFRRASEYIPLYFSLAAAVLLAAALLLARPCAGGLARPRLSRRLGWRSPSVSPASSCISTAASSTSARSGAWSTPRRSPRRSPTPASACCSIVNRMVGRDTREWAQWVLLLALGGFFGNFVFSLTDHAQNGFFQPLEWMPVVSSAFAIGFLLVPFAIDVTSAYLRLCAAMLGVQVLVGIAGSLFHLAADIGQPGATLVARIISGAPPMAPLLFVNLSLLAGIALAAWFDEPEALRP